MIKFMNKHTFKLAYILLITLLTACSTPQSAPTKTTNLPLTSTTGSFSHTWLPNNQGFLKITHTPTTQFQKIHPVTQQTSPLFTQKIQDQIITAFNKYTNQKTTVLPFKRFRYTDQNQSISYRNKNISYTYNLKTNKIYTPIKANPKLLGWKPHRSSRQLTDGSTSPNKNLIAYIKGYDIYTKDRQGKETRLTLNGTKDIMNGRTNWIYPEELSQSNAFFWSPDSTKIAYLQFDVRKEHIHSLIHEINLNKKSLSQHHNFNAILEKQRYPKPGNPNATVRLFIVDLKTKKSIEVQTNPNQDQYIIKPIWKIDNTQLYFQRLNRFQNKLELLTASPTTGQSKVILTDTNTAYIDLHNNFRQLKNSNTFLWTSEKSGWNHLYHYNFNGKLINQLTTGKFEVSRISLIDEKTNTIYFTTNMTQGLESHLCKVNIETKTFKQLTKPNYNHRTSIDPSGNYFTTTYSAINTPSQKNLYDTDGLFIRTLAKTTLNKQALKQQNIQLPELITFKAADGITNLNAILYKPKNFDPSKKYPLLLSVYAGPSQGVRNSYRQRTNYTDLGFIVLKQDNRGTTNRGKKYLNQTYMKLGQVEIDDQAAGIKQIIKRPYIDANRVGIHGHSYGGYATCMAMLRYPNIFQVGVASSSVTDWRGYDTIYAERYMRTPQANPEGYKLASAMHYAKNLKGKLYLIHGLIDNNVHVGNTYHLADALQKHGKTFDLMIYPENRHGIRGYHGKHFQKIKKNYFLKHLKPDNWKQNTIK